MDDLAAVEAAIYDQSFRALDEQARVLDALRTRAGTLLSGASVATALLGGLAGGATRPAAHERLDGASWVAIGLFVSVVLLSLRVMTPAKAAFSHHPDHLIEAYLNHDPQASLSEYRRAIAFYNGRNLDANTRQLHVLPPRSRLLACASDASSSSGYGSWQADQEEAEAELARVTDTAVSRHECERERRPAEALERADALDEQLDERG
jgi:hypothetical protein